MTIGQGQTQAITAFSRFGLGARLGDLARAARDPRGVLVEELRTANVALIKDGALPSGVAALRADYLDQQARRIERQKMAMAPPIEKVAADPRPKPAAEKPAPPRPPSVEQALFRAEAGARLAMQLQASPGFVERLVAFWSNHFAVSVAKSQALLVLAGPVEREAPERSRQILDAAAGGREPSGDDPLSWNPADEASSFRNVLKGSVRITLSVCAFFDPAGVLNVR
jgi:uncharacterized protein (DUF1800 family)